MTSGELKTTLALYMELEALAAAVNEEMSEILCDTMDKVWHRLTPAEVDTLNDRMRLHDR